MKSETNPPIWQEIPAALLVPAACIGFTRVFVEASATIPIIAAALLSSAVAVIARRLRLPLVVAAMASIVLLLMLIMRRYAGESLQLGILPTGETPQVLRDLSSDLLIKFQEVKSPVDSHPSFVAAAILGAWIMSFLTDWGAMRLRLAFEPVLPAALLFVFTSIAPINAGQNQLVSTIAFALAVAAWAVVQRAASLFQRGVWLANDGQRGPASVGKAGAVVAVIAVIVGALVGGRLPGADADPVWKFSEDPANAREVISPFVRIRDRLETQTNVQLFTVTADQPTYWRIAGLDDYVHYAPNGELKASWQVRASFNSADGSLPTETELGGERERLEQSYDINALQAIWLPAAYAPTELVDSTHPVTWNTENSTLSVPNNREFSDDIQYTIVSSRSKFTVAELRAAPAAIPDDIRERFTQVPDRIPQRVSQMAQDIVAGQPTRYDQMKQLQDHFRQYEYSVDNIRNGTQDPFDQFLDERSGFCQDFSGTFTLMARTLGIPARVAVGFTWGEPVSTDEQGRTTYRVTGRQAHAWPEVYFEGLGWVPFEPTPNRGLPEAVQYTGAEARQDTAAPENSGVPTTLPPTTAVENGAGLNPIPSTTIPPLDEGALTPDSEPIPGEAEVGSQRSLSDLISWIPWRWLLVLALVGAYVIGLPLIYKLRRQQRRTAAKNDADRVETAWAESAESLELGFDLRRSESETRKEFAERLMGDPRLPGHALDELATATTVARFHPTGVTAEQGEAALHRADEIDASMRERVPKLTLLGRQLNPMRLVKPSRRPTARKRQTITTLSSQNVRKATVNKEDELTGV